MTITEEKPRVQKVAEELYKSEDLMRPKKIAEILGESALNVGRDLHDLKKRGIAETEGEGLWKLTDDGREWLESGASKVKVKPSKGEISGTVPLQSDLFRSIGERLGVGAKKGEVRLDAIIYYVQRTALCFIYSLVQGVQLKSSGVQLSLDFIENSNLRFHTIKKWFSPEA
jgi:hypothetical protein